jgi:phosphonate transport system ATP-binding protein
MIMVKNLIKKYDDKTVLKGINLEINPGEFIALIGGSGSGKSTLLHCLALKEKWNKGELIYNGNSVDQSSLLTKWKIKGDWAVLEQPPNLNRQKSAYKNVISGRLRNFPLWRLLLGGRASTDEHVHVMNYLEKVGLLDKASLPLTKLSGGEVQRVAIAKALCQGAKIIFADDPVSNLDPQSAEKVLQDLKKLCEKDGLTVIIALQNVEMAETYATRIVGLNEGKAVLDIRGRRLTQAEKQKVL